MNVASLNWCLGVGGLGGEEGNRKSKQRLLFLHEGHRENECLDIYCSVQSSLAPGLTFPCLEETHA